MKIPLITIRCLWLIPGCLLAVPAGAFDFGNMMNPNEWVNGNRDRDDYGDYYGPPGGYGYPNSYAPVPGYAQPGYAAPGYTDPGYMQQGYGAPGYTDPGYTQQGYGAPGYPAPAYAAPQTSAPAAKSGSSAADAAEIARLKQRVRELEAERSGQATHWQATQPADAGTTYFPPPDGQVNESGGNTIESWQAPTTPSPAPGNTPSANETSAEVIQTPVQDRQASPSMDGYGVPATGSSGVTPMEGSTKWQYEPGEAERNAARYTPPPQNQGPTTYDFGR